MAFGAETYFAAILAIVCLNAIPLALVGVGIYLVATPNHRQNRINEFNTAVADWEQHHRSEFIHSVNVSSMGLLSDDSHFSIVNGSEPYLSIAKLRDKHDRPAPRDYRAYFFHTTHNFGTIRYDVSHAPLGGTFEYLVGKTTTATETEIETETNTEISIKATSDPFITTSSQVYCRNRHSSCTSNQNKCELEGGHYVSPQKLDDPNCFWYYYLTRLCSLVDANSRIPSRVGRPDWLDKSASESTGCFYEILFKYRSTGAPEEFYEHASYAQASSNKKIFDDYTIAFQVRTRFDPLVVLNRITEGSYDFGTPAFLSWLSGIVILGVGATAIVIECCCIMSILLCISEICKNGNWKKYCPCNRRRTENTYGLIQDPRRDLRAGDYDE